MRVRLVRRAGVDGVQHEIGDVVDVPIREAQRMCSAGLAVPVREDEDTAAHRTRARRVESERAAPPAVTEAADGD